VPHLLLAWVGRTDLQASVGVSEAGLGPIGQAVTQRSFDEIVLISDFDKKESATYQKWLQTQTANPVALHNESLNTPTDFGAIYDAAVNILEKTLARWGGAVELTFHLSPGTPAMAAVWIILAKTRFPAELIESSKQGGVRTASVPFDISAEYIPDLLRRPDEQLARSSMGLPPVAPEFDRIVHRSAVMKRTVAMARRVAVRKVSVLIDGESGTGKELFARAIHQASPRHKKPFVAVSCGAIPRELVESELFGHEKGAFTGAEKTREGHFEQADGGTLFLDEIGELPLSTQVKLLRVLQESEVTKVGSSKPKKVDIRIVAATNRDLITEISKGSFREDLFYRIAMFVIHLPPLRERPGDVGLLIDDLLEHLNLEAAKELGVAHKTISPGARNLLLAHDWPGNIRELQNTLVRAAVWSNGEQITQVDVKEALLQSPIAQNDNILNRSLGAGLDIQDVMSKVAKHYLDRALTEAKGNKTEAAKLVGLNSYQTFSNWAKKYGLK
jgi:DNA-binding NtrC family response regulator